MSEKTTTILILGGGVMQLPALRIAREKGWRIILADGNPSPPGLPLADEFLNIDLVDREAMARAAERLRESSGLDGVFTAGTDFSATVAWVAERVGLPGIPYQTALRATDKALMRSAFLKEGVPSPRFLVAEASDEPPELSGLAVPVVVKPVDNMGARGTRRIDDRAELPGAIATALRFSRSRRAIVEEFLEGPEYSIDAIVERGRITLCGVADRHIAFAPYFIEMGHTMPSSADGATIEALASCFEKGVRAIGIENGAAKGDVKLTPRGPAIGEIAARLSGGYMSGWTYPYASGVLPTEAALNIAVGLPAGDLVPRWRMVSAERAFISIPGRVARVVGFEAACKLPGIKEGFLRVSAGDEVTFPRNNVEKCGNFISQASTREGAAEAAEEACRTVFVLLEPGREETAAFLFGGEDWPPDAFRRNGDLESRLAAIPPYDGRPDERIIRGGTPVGIIPLDEAASPDGRDWHGATVHDALERVRILTGAKPGGGSPFRLGSLFWRALLRGGAQGATWVIESVEEHLRRGGRIENLLEKWRR